MNSLTSIAVTLAACAWAASATGTDVLTIGDGDCGTFIEDKTKDGVRYSQWKAWLAGFYTAHNLTCDVTAACVPVKTPSTAAMYLWVENYCRENPLDPVTAAMWIFVRELRGR